MYSRLIVWLLLSSYCNTQQHTATHYNTLQHTAVYCNTLKHTADNSPLGTTTYCKKLHNIVWSLSTRFFARKLLCPLVTATLSATHCNIWQHTATHCSTLHQTATYCNTLHYTATHCITTTMLNHSLSFFFILSISFSPSFFAVVSSLSLCLSFSLCHSLFSPSLRPQCLSPRFTSPPFFKQLSFSPRFVPKLPVFYLSNK